MVMHGYDTGAASVLHRDYARTALTWRWYGAGAALVLRWGFTGSALVVHWYDTGVLHWYSTGLVHCWYYTGSVLGCAQYKWNTWDVHSTSGTP